MNFETNLMFQFFLVVVCGFMDKDMNVNKFSSPTTKHFIKGEKCETFKGANFVVC